MHGRCISSCSCAWCSSRTRHTTGLECCSAPEHSKKRHFLQMKEQKVAQCRQRERSDVFFLLAVERRWSEMTNNGIHSPVQPPSCSEPCFWQNGEHSPPPVHLRAPGDHPDPHRSTRDNQGSGFSWQGSGLWQKFGSTRSIFPALPQK